MQSYSMFVTKKGRPKAQPKKVCVQNENRNHDIDVVQSLFMLKKINQKQYDAAKIYEVLCVKYYASIEAPNYSATSFTSLPMHGCKVRNISTNDDQVIFQHWFTIKSILNKISNECESMMYKVIIERKMKYELLNPMNLTKNNMQIFCVGLDAIYNYAMSNTYVMNLIA